MNCLKIVSFSWISSPSSDSLTSEFLSMCCWCSLEVPVEISLDLFYSCVRNLSELCLSYSLLILSWLSFKVSSLFSLVYTMPRESSLSIYENKESLDWISLDLSYEKKKYNNVKYITKSLKDTITCVINSLMNIWFWVRWLTSVSWYQTPLTTRSTLSMSLITVNVMIHVITNLLKRVSGRGFDYDYLYVFFTSGEVLSRIKNLNCL